SFTDCERTYLVLSFESEGSKTMCALRLKRASVENAQNHYLGIAFPHIPDALRCNRRSQAGGHSLEADDPDQPSFTRRRKSCASICTFLAMSGSWSFSNMISLAAISAASLGLKPRINSPLARMMKLSGARYAVR